ncbi:MAG: non-canonical purine NTP pyrophosphatase [Candidatus Rokubacteria bacterium]|nr:non-canonical purine NTP pyrophosphatase [Candidatus Rokubacteria bacterium]
MTSASSPARRLLVVATLNAAKGREIRSLLADLPFDVRPLGDYPGVTLPAETEPTYAGNALLKARAAARLTGALALADDSGIEVDALGGGPGVLSARFAGPGLDDAGRNAHLLEAIRGVPDDRRTARYRCVVAIVDPGDGGRSPREWTVEGTCDGRLLCAPRGTGGFGYDPLFFYPPFGRTLAEVTPEEKARVSHRGIALRRARDVLSAMLYS